MDYSFVKNNDPRMLEEIIKRILLRVNTAMPGTIVSFDSVTQMATVQPNINALKNSIDFIAGTPSQKINLPELLNVPIVLPYSTSTGYCLTFPIKKGDQCLIIFNQRNIGNWKKNSGVNDPGEANYPRAHDLADAIVIPGAIANPNAIADYKNDRIELRDVQRNNAIGVVEGGIEIVTEQLDLTVSGDINIISQHGNINLVSQEGDITATANIGDIVSTAEQGNIIATAELGDVQVSAPQGEINLSSNNSTIVMNSEGISLNSEYLGIVFDDANRRIYMHGDVMIDGILSAPPL